MRTLVLNAGYEPLAVVSFKRAIILVLNQKATVLAQAGVSVVRSATGEYKLPSVILLSRYVRIPGSRVIPVSRRGVLRRDGHRCGYCKRLHEVLETLNVTVVERPISVLGTRPISEAVICAADRRRAVGPAIRAPARPAPPRMWHHPR